MTDTRPIDLQGLAARAGELLADVEQAQDALRTEGEDTLLAGLRLAEVAGRLAEAEQELQATAEELTQVRAARNAQ